MRKSVQELHVSRGAYEDIALVSERFKVETACEGSVLIFLVRLPNADISYACAALMEGSRRERVYPVLKIPPVVDPATAVRASIISEWQSLYE